LSKEYAAEDIEDGGSKLEDGGSKVEAVTNLQSSTLDSRQGYVMPDFRGRGVRAVTQACAQMKLTISLHGSGTAFRQSPAAGTRVRAGETCKVEFQ
ncbi:MAG TPA: PASTA domain-containing protein, partial [Blastocatellia bacterium]